MSLSSSFGNERITTIRFRMESTVDHVTARLLEAARQTDLSLFSVVGDGNSVYPPEERTLTEARNPARSASSWRAELFWRDGASDMGRNLELFRCRAERFLDCRNGIQVEPKGPRRNVSRRRTRNRRGYGLDGAFRSVLDESV